MINKENLRQIKILVGQFHHECQSNSITDFVTWIDCKGEFLTENKKQHKVKNNGNSK